MAGVFVDFGQKSFGRRVGWGGDATDCAGVVGREVFWPWRPLEVMKPWQARTFAAAELAPSMTLKSYWAQKP